MGPPENGNPESVVAYQLRAMKETIAGLRAEMQAGFDREDRRFEQLEGRLGSLEFVRKDVYDVRHTELERLLASEVRQREEADAATAKTAERAVQLAQWAIGILMMLVLVLIGAAVKVLAG